jgi:hypothetical protein
MTTILMATIPDADPLPLPAPLWLLRSLLLLTFFLHLLAMNFVLGGSIIAAVARARSKSSENLMRLGQWFGRSMPVMIPAAITFGVAPLLFLQALYGRLFFTSSVLMGWYWWSVVPVLIVAYYCAYYVATRNVAAGLPVLMSLLFVAIAFVYSNNMTLMLRADRFLSMYLEDGRGVQLNFADASLYPRFLHMLLGAIAVAGLIVALYGIVKMKTDDAHGRWAVRFGSRWFIVATLVNLATGMWWLGVLPRDVVLRFMGGSAVATVSLAAGIVFSIAAIALMLGAAAAPQPRVLVARSAIAVVLTLVAMIISRDEVRNGMLSRVAFQPATWIEPQWGVMAIFGVLLVGALATTVWMVMALMRARTV